jgi:hypothetical protein
MTYENGGNNPEFDSVETEQAYIGDALNRPQTTNGDISLDVTDYADGIELAKDIPIEIRDRVTIDVPSGASRTDILIPPYIGGNQITKGTSAESISPIDIIGDRSSPSDHPVTVYVEGVSAKLGVGVLGCEIPTSNPYDDESVGIAAYHAPATVQDCVYTGGTNGVLAWGGDANLELGAVDFGSSALSGDGARVKHGGIIFEQKGQSTPTQGTVGGYAYDPQVGVIWFDRDKSSLSGSSGLVRSATNRWGQVYDGSRSDGYRDYTLSEISQTVLFNNGWVSNGPAEVAVTGNGVGVSNLENLSGKTGNFDGELRRDDGTNVGAGEYCRWLNGPAEWKSIETGTQFS